VYVSYSDENEFHRADPRRKTSDEVDLGATWRQPGAVDAWRLTWLRDTGELYLCRSAGFPAPAADVRVLLVVPDEKDLDALLAGWQDHRTDEDSLGWLSRRLTPVAA
jgi:hypothetical protein